jgi:AmmeMemoRadiSam system protein B
LQARSHVVGSRTLIALTDPAGLMPRPIMLSAQGFRHVVSRLDGTLTLPEIQLRMLYETGQWIEQASLHALIDELEISGALEGPTWEALEGADRSLTIRAPALAGRSYPDDPAELRSSLTRYMESAGQTASDTPCRPTRGVVSPHIDFARGGIIYAHAYQTLAHRCNASVFIVLGVAHQYCGKRFALTRKHFDTPLGLVETDRETMNALISRVGPDYFQDEIAHRTEHSIEFQAVFLRHAVASNRPISIVPILVGSFHDHVRNRTSPAETHEIRSMIESIRELLEGSDGRIALVAGIDLCHVGPDFGDPAPVDEALLETVRDFDQRMLACAADGDAEGWFQQAAEVRDRYRVCGLAATYVFLKALGGRSGTLLDYTQAVSANRRTCVTIAGMAFE